MSKTPLSADMRKDYSMLFRIAVRWNCGRTFLLLCLLLAMAIPLSAREKYTTPYGAGLIVNLPFPESDVTQVLQDVVQDGIIRGTKEYNKDEYVSGATAESSTRAFPTWKQDGKVFYKVRLKALDPRNFKDGNDVGTLAVRYVVQSQGEKNLVLRIDAVFVEDFRHSVHLSNGSVESAEYKDIHDRLDAMTAMKEQTAQPEKAAEKASVERKVEQNVERRVDQKVEQKEDRADDSAAPAPQIFDTAGVSNGPAAMTLAQRVQNLRQQVERLVKAPGAPLKSAPFHTASTLQSLAAGTEVLVVITTPYWVGVETHEGQHGWIMRDELEQIQLGKTALEKLQ